MDELVTDRHTPEKRPQAGPELRDALAAALIARIKQAVIPPPLPFGGQIGSVFAATEFDLADAVLPVVRQHLAAAEQGRRMAEAATEVWRANAELAVDQRDQARAAITRVSERCQGARERVGPGGMINASQILGLLSPTWPDGNYEAAAAVAQADPEQPVSGPPEVDESAGDSCQIVHVDGSPVLVRGQGDMDDTTAGHLAEVVRAVQRRYAAEHPDGPPAPRRTTRTFRRLAAALTGTVRDEHGQPICTCTPDAKCPACQTGACTDLSDATED